MSSSIGNISGQTGRSATDTKSTNRTLGQDQFLGLLVAQLKNQDPLNPSDPTEFTAQLAQYSQLEQLFNLNDSMRQISLGQQDSDKMSSLSLIGQDVILSETRFELADAPVQIGYQIKNSVGRVDIQIRNRSGQTVATLRGDNTSMGTHFMTWSGKDASGTPLAPGSYSIAVSSDGSAGAVGPLVRTPVTGINLSGPEARIVTRYGEYGLQEIHGAYERDQQATDSDKG
ncbi:MAG: flagellar hook assembly protein FlgD [Desulfobulbus sp.]|jgi:flagellar basal-body rod modification protein FlgD